MAVKAFKEMKTKNLECRTLGHAWYHQASFVPAAGFAQLHFTCRRCGCVREDIYIRKTGELQSRRYTHPDKYLVDNLKEGWGGRAVFNGNVRVELIGRLMKGVRA